MKTNLLHLLTLVCLAPLICQAQVNFSSSSFPLSITPSKIVTGDFNGDGKMDIATAETSTYPSNRLSVLLGNGSGGFSAFTSYGLRPEIRDLLAADLNGDAKADLMVLDGSDSVSILLGDGTGGLTLAGYLAVGTYSVSMAVGDFNLDGKKDLATANYSSDNVSVLLGNGMGGFAPAHSFTVGLSPYDLVAKDFNGDGNTDLASADLAGNTISILLNDGLGGFALHVSYPIGTSPYDFYELLSEDINQDGYVDLLIPQNDKITVLLGDGSGKFNPGSSIFVIYSYPNSKVVTADFDGDQKTDLAISDISSNQVTMYFGKGNGHFSVGLTFAFSVVSEYNSYYHENLAVGDFNLDGKIDLLSGFKGYWNTNSMSLLLNSTPEPTATLPTITDFTPSTGSIDYNIIINGANFSGATSIKFNGTPTPFVLTSATQVTAKVPMGATTGRISITKANNVATSGTVFTIALPSPAGLQARVISGSRIELSWINSVKDSSYVIEQALSADGPYKVLGTSGTYLNQYTSSGLLLGTTYYYRIKAAYSATTWAYSKVVSATTPSTSPPNPPYLDGYAPSKTEVLLDWEADNEIETTSMVLERARASDGIYSVIAVSSGYSDQDAFADKNLQAGTTYSYRLKAVNSVGSSPYVETLITTDPQVTVYHALPQWNKRLGGSGDDWLNTVIRTPDGGYLLGGRSLSGVSGDHSQPGLGGSDIWIVKLDAQGNKRWDKRYGGGSYDSVDEIVITADGGYLLAGGSSSGIGGDRSESLRGQGDFWILKIDANGNRQWDHRYGGSGQEGLRSLIKTIDGGYLLGGFSASGANGDKSQTSQGGYDYWIVKVNASGVKQWDKRFGGSGDDQLVSMVQNADGSYLLGGSSDSPVSGDQSQGPRSYGYSMDYWIVKINSAGTKVWDRRYGGDYGDYLSALVPTPDGGYLLGGSSDSGPSGDRSADNKIQMAACGEYDSYNYSIWLVKINGSGVKQWDKAFLGGGFPSDRNSNDDFLSSLITTNDGGYLLGGTSASRRGYDKSETSWGESELNNFCYSFNFFAYQSSSDYWIIKLASDGNREWDKSFGGYGSEVLSAVVQDTDGSFVLAGYSNSAADGDKSQAGQGLNDYWVVKTNPTSPVSLIRLNSAGPGVATTLGNFSADWYFTGSSEVITKAMAIAGTTDDVLYDDYRQATTGNFGYNIPVNNGTYSVRLLFAETFYTATGQRKFNVSAEGVSWLSNFDIVADAGAARKAAIKSRLVTVKDGNLTLNFASLVGKAMVSAIEILPANGGRQGEEMATSAEGIRLQAYPNPFTTQVTLAFSVEQTDQVTLEVYDLQGTLIKHLYQGEVEGGQTYEVTMGSETLRSGMYIGRLTSTTQVANQKLVLVH